MKSALLALFAIVYAVPALGQTPATPLRDAAYREATRLATVPFARSPQTTQTRDPNWIARHPVLTGSLIGLGIGFPIGYATCKYPGVEGPCNIYTYPGNAHWAGGITWGLIGTGIGAGIGALIGASQ